MALAALASDDVDLEPRFGALGAAGTRLLAGPEASAGAESLDAHVGRLGELQLGAMVPAELRAMIAESGLQGRGGGQFPIAEKLGLAARSGGQPLVVVNGSEGEPASRKDRTLLAYRPHLVLDGAMVAARAVGAREVVVYLHRDRRDATAALESAIRERTDETASVRLVDAPARYVAGESSAVVAYLQGDGALPRKRPIPVAGSGVCGRPTVVNNVETIAHLALIARFGPAWFCEVGDAGTPGSTLVTVAGEVSSPLSVAEVIVPTTIGEVLERADPTLRVTRAVLVGGYEGTWIDGPVAMGTLLSRGSLKACGASLGCGVLAVVGTGSCGLATTARLVRWLAGESAGQCGPCIFGLPAIADLLDCVADGTADRSDVRRLRLLTASVYGRGGCGHPSGVVGLVDSALDTFSPELCRHLRGRGCATGASGFPLPTGWDLT
jgi:NADH:ubiquinone oxidoreductase subunit F (NADH-binding)